MGGPQSDLGQHLLRDERAISRIVDAAQLKLGQTVLDAGAGRGALTQPLADAVGPTGRVWAIELDAAMLQRLHQDLPPQVRVIEGDLLDVAIPPDVDMVVANPPFKIAAPLIQRILDARIPRAVLVIPRELADRLLAAPGTERYGKLTVRIALRARVDDLGYLTRHAFDPPPQIVCGIVRIRTRKDAEAVDEAALTHVLDAAWAAWERKAKYAFVPLAQLFRADRAALSKMLKDEGWAEERTGTLPPEAFAAIARHLHERGRVTP